MLYMYGILGILKVQNHSMGHISQEIPLITDKIYFSRATILQKIKSNYSIYEISINYSQ